MPSSSPIKAISKLSGKIWKKANNPPVDSIVHAKPAIIFKSVWPEVMFAKSRIDKVNTLII